MAVEMSQEGGGKDITRPSRVNLSDRIGREALRDARAEKDCPMTAIGRNKQGNKPTPACEQSIDLIAAPIGKGEEIVMAEDQGIEQR